MTFMANTLTLMYLKYLSGLQKKACDALRVKIGQVWWHMTVIPATLEAEIRRAMI
jgi:hypothetical protein